MSNSSSARSKKLASVQQLTRSRGHNEAACGGTQCRVLGPEEILHSKRSGASCSVRNVYGIFKRSTLAEIIQSLLIELDPDHTREGLRETPMRAAKAWEVWTEGYGQDPKKVFKVFQDGAEQVDEMVLLRNIPFYSHCEHHLAPFFGTCTIAYVPNGRIVGFSKLSRLVDIFAHRFQVQERMTNQIADSIVYGLGPLGVGVVMKARHFCMESRGIKHQGMETITSALRGAMRKKSAARSEFLHLANGDSK